MKLLGLLVVVIGLTTACGSTTPPKDGNVESVAGTTSGRPSGAGSPPAATGLRVSTSKPPTSVQTASLSLRVSAGLGKPLGDRLLIGSVEPSSACVESRITLKAPPSQPFPATQGDYNVYFQAACAFTTGVVQRWTTSEIAVTIPKEAVSGAVVVTSGPVMRNSVGADLNGVKSCLNAVSEFEHAQFDVHHGITWPPVRSPIVNPIPFLNRPSSATPAVTTAMPPTFHASSMRQACGTVNCSVPLPGLIGTLLTVKRQPDIGNLFVKPGFKTAASEYGVLETDALMTWSLRGEPDSLRLTNRETGAVSNLAPNAGQQAIRVDRRTQVTLEARNACGADTESATLLPAYQASWEAESVTVQPRTPQQVHLRLSRPTTTPLTLKLTGTRVKLPSTTVTFAAGARDAVVAYELDSTFEPGGIEASAAPGALVQAPGMFLVLAPAAPASTATGIVEYENCNVNNTFDANGKFHYGFACAGAFLPARNVEVWFELPLTNGWKFYAKGRTDDAGAFSIQIPSPANGTGQIGTTVQIHVPTENLLITNTANVFFEGAVQPSYSTSVSRGNGLHNLRLQIRDAQAAPFNAYDNVVAIQRYLAATMGWTPDEVVRNLHRFVISLDGSWCLGADVHTQQIPSNTMMCIGDPVEMQTPNKLTSTLFDDDTVRHEFGHHLQNMMGQWQPIPRYHNGCWVSLQSWDLKGAPGCGMTDTNFDGSRWSNSAEYAWFEGFPSYFSDRVARHQGWPMGSRWCLGVAGATFCTSPCQCTAVGHKTTGLLHTIGAAEIEDYVVSVLHEAHASNTLTDRDVIHALWNGLRGTFPNIYNVRDKMTQNGANVGTLNTFMQNYGM